LYFSAKESSFLLSVVSFLVIFCSTPAFCAAAPIATLTDFSGTILIKSRGTWGIEPAKGLSLYSEDKVVTRTGSATITFSDGAILEIKSNSNLLIQESKKEKSFVGQVKVVERRVLLFLGKLFFRTGKAEIETRFETATAVVGIRGTAGILSIDAKGRTYIKFTEGRAAYLLGDFIEGVAKDVPAELANQNSVQRATFVANAAADQVRRTKEKFSAGKVPQAQVDLAKAIAYEATAREVLAYAKSLLTSTDSIVVRRAKQQILQAKEAIRAAKEAQRNAIEDGADPEFKIFTPDDPGFDVPAEPPVKESEPQDSNNLASLVNCFTRRT